MPTAPPADIDAYLSTLDPAKRAALQALRETIRDIRRRAKYLLFDLRKGHLLVHLGMSGRLTLLPAGTPARKHDHVETISYGMPGFRRGGEMVAGFAAAERHLGYYPHSGRVIDSVAAATPELLAGLTWSKGALRLPLDRPIPRALVSALIATRLADISSRREG